MCDVCNGDTGIHQFVESYRAKHPDSQARHQRRLKAQGQPRDSRGRFKRA